MQIDVNSPSTYLNGDHPSVMFTNFSIDIQRGANPKWTSYPDSLPEKLPIKALNQSCFRS